MSELRKSYAALRAEGRGHSSAIARLARSMDVDPLTVARVLRRAESDSAPAGSAGTTTVKEND